MPYPIPGLPARLHLARDRSGWSLDVVARRVGCSKRWVQDLESGERNPPLHWLMALAQTYGVSTDWLLFGDGPTPPVRT